MIAVLFLIVMALCTLSIIRSHVTMVVRMAILQQDGLAAHAALPSFDAMYGHPAFWLKWTVADWREYIARRQA